MIVSVLIPSEEYKTYAGARIRYGRLTPELERHGVRLTLEEIGSFDPATNKSDAILISKCHDSRALVAAAAATSRGRLVGVDLFDDYFSQIADSRLARFRLWLRQLMPSCDFALCSTPTMAGVIRTYKAELPVQVVNDPAPAVDFDKLPSMLERKLATTRNDQTIRLAWFGVGDNPYFHVGLSDLAGFSEALRSLAKGSVNVQLSVLTNERALTPDGLALIAGVPVPAEVQPWSEAAEQELLNSAFACFLPVNAQRFSAAKSLNRAFTALSAGCQVISVGYPLYAALDDLIYRDADSFLADLKSGAMKHSAARLETYRSAIDSHASSAREAVAIAKFLVSIKPNQSDVSAPIALIQGQAPNGLAHKAVKALKGLSIASPFCTPTLGFDVIFRGSDRTLIMLVSDSAASRLKPHLRNALRVATTVSDRKFWLVPGADDDNSDTETGKEWHSAALPFQIAAYAPAMAEMRERISTAFGPCRVLISENSQLPFISAL
jgi:hypothetical protein